MMSNIKYIEVLYAEIEHARKLAEDDFRRLRKREKKVETKKGNQK